MRLPRARSTKPTTIKKDASALTKGIVTRDPTTPSTARKTEIQKTTAFGGVNFIISLLLI